MYCTCILAYGDIYAELFIASDDLPQNRDNEAEPKKEKREIKKKKENKKEETPRVETG